VPNLLDHALSVVNRGWFVFPCEPRAKEPQSDLANHGFKDAVSNVSAVRALWAQKPEANPAIATGASGLVVLDIDHGLADVSEFRAWYKKHGLPPTYIVRSGKRTEYGAHIYFKGKLPTGSFEFDGCTGNVISATGYVIAAGGIHPISGESYAVLCDRPLVPVPDLISTFTKDPTPRPSRKSAEKIKPHERHFYLLERGIELSCSGLSDEGLISALRWLYFNRCVRDGAKDAGIENELRNVVKWIDEHPLDVSLNLKDYIKLRVVEKDPRTQSAFAGELQEFNGDAEEALMHLISKLSAEGCKEEQIHRIVAASPLFDVVNR
jgi:hypothetical protein